MSALLSERLFRQALVWIAIAGLLFGLLAWTLGRSDVANWCWAGGTVPVVIGLLVSMVRDFLAGRLGVDAVAFVSMSGALALGQNLAGIVVALMYAGGNLLEDLAVARAERDLRSLVDRAPRRAHRRSGSVIEDVPIEQVAVGDEILVRAGDVIPVDGIIVSPMAMLDEAAVTGEPIPVNRQKGELARSGSLNAGEVFELRASTTANESTYAGIVRMVSAAQTAKAPFVRMADRYALLLLPLTLITAGAAWYFSGDPIRALAVLVASTPCPLILAAPVAFIAGVAQAAKRGILVKGSGSLEALARTHTVIFDKTGTLTIGGARLVAVEVAPGESSDEVLRIAGSLEQASHHVLAATVVEAAVAKGLKLTIPSQVRETMGSGLEGIVDGRKVRVGSHQLVYGRHQAGKMGCARFAARVMARCAERVCCRGRANDRGLAAGRRTPARYAARRASASISRRVADCDGDRRSRRRRRDDRGGARSRRRSCRPRTGRQGRRRGIGATPIPHSHGR